MNAKILKYTFFFTCSVLIFKLEAQMVIDMKRAIELSQSNSDMARLARLKLDHTRKEYDLTKKNFLPTLRFSTVTPIFTKETTRITTPDGEDIFVGQNQIFNDIGISVEQKEPIFNGTFELRSSLNRIDIRGNTPSVSYFSRPISIRYSNQNLIFNEQRWNQEIFKNKMDLSAVVYNEELCDISIEAAELFFSLFISLHELHRKTDHLSNLRSVHRLLEERLRLGTTTQDELYTNQIRILEIENDSTQASIDHSLKKSKLAELMGLEALDFKIDTSLHSFPALVVLPEDVIPLINLQNSTALQFEKDDLEIRKEIKKTSKEDLVNLNLDMSFGLSNTGRDISEATSNLIDQQFFSVSINYNIFDFGKRNSQIDVLRIQQEIRQLEHKQAMEEYSFNLTSIVQNIKSSRELLAVLARAKTIGYLNYENYLTRFQYGNISVEDINSAYDKIESLNQRHYETLKKYWLSYYQLRKETMFDFEKSIRLN